MYIKSPLRELKQQYHYKGKTVCIKSNNVFLSFEEEDKLPPLGNVSVFSCLELSMIALFWVMRW